MSTGKGFLAGWKVQTVVHVANITAVERDGKYDSSVSIVNVDLC